jgi:hypothetical protein
MIFTQNFENLNFFEENKKNNSKEGTFQESIKNQYNMHPINTTDEIIEDQSLSSRFKVNALSNS